MRGKFLKYHELLSGHCGWGKVSKKDKLVLISYLELHLDYHTDQSENYVYSN